ncbi:hypothetical protein IW150_005692 [Coemansia sp. RSA 2607]|nr:hypothetical protein IW150_005692 [Coemansia sp. RSA 2607]KAJ2388229.1 hypothetical protein GGI05_003848 [Coemansia sp. RSA 2603]
MEMGMFEFVIWVDYNKEDAMVEMENPVRVGCYRETTAKDVVSLLVEVLKLDSLEERLAYYEQNGGCKVVDKDTYVTECRPVDGYFYLR